MIYGVTTNFDGGGEDATQARRNGRKPHSSPTSVGTLLTSLREDYTKTV